MNDQNKQQQGEQSMLPSLPFSKQQALITSGTLVAGELAGFVADMAMHSATHNGMFLGAAATVLVAANSKRLTEAFMPKPADEIRESTERIIEAVAPVTEVHPDQRAISKLKRLVGIPTPPPTWPKDTSEDEQYEPEDEFEEALPPPARRGVFNFSSLLGGFTPTLDKIYLGMLQDGTHVFCKASELCHVALAGATDAGKSSIMRLLMAQLCYARAQVLLLNPHFTRYDIAKDDDWTPFEPYLLHPPMECRKYDVIEHYLKYTAETLLPRRLEKYANSLPWGKPYFLVMDELPMIIQGVPKAPEYLSAILRQGRKVGIYIISASQDFLVKTIAPDGSGGAVRDCYRTAFYVGGDSTTGKIMLDMAPKDIPEQELGTGQVMLRCAKSPLVKKAARATVPYVDNQALYMLLGPSTYQPSQHIDVTEEPLPQPEREQRAQHQYQPAQPAQVLPQTPRPQRMEPLAPNPLQRSRALPPPEIVEAVKVYQPGMTYRELGRALNYTDGEARVIWRELSERYRYLLVAKGGRPTNATTVLDDEPVQQQSNPDQLSRELRIALNLYKAGHDSYRKLGEAMVIDKDRAGKLIRELQNMGLIEKGN